MSHATSLTSDFAVVVGVASLSGIVFRRFGQPPVLGYLLAGLLIGPYIPLPLFADVKRTTELSEFGVVLVMFAVGLEFSFKRVAEILPLAGVTALVQIGGLLGAGYLLGLALGLDPVGAVFLGASVAISSTMVVTKVFAEHPPDESVRSFVLGVLVLQDIAAIILIATVTAIAQGAGLDPLAIAGVVGRLFGTLAATLIVGMVVIPRLARFVGGLGSPEVLVVFGVGTCFAMASGAEHLGYSPALGAFLAGILVAESGRARPMEHLIAPVRDVFAAVFFASVGMAVDPAVAVLHLGEALAVAAGVITMQFVLVTAAGLLSGTGLQRAIQSSLALGQIGEFGFIIMGIGVAVGVVPATMFSVIVTASVLTTFTTPVGLALAPRIANRVERHLPARLREGLSLYTAWLDDLRRAAPSSPRRSGVRRTLRVLVIDAAAVSALGIGVSVGDTWILEVLLQPLGLSAGLAKGLLLVGTLAIMAPFLRSIVRCAGVLAALLSRTVFPERDETDPTHLFDTSRRAMTVTLQLTILLATGIPLVAITQPFVPPGVGLALLAIISIPTTVYMWRSTHDLQEHVRSAAVALVEAVRLGPSPTLPPVFNDLLHGLGDPTTIALPPDAPAVGSTLAALNLRAATGATVLAIARPQGDVSSPKGHDRLEAGDTLAVAGPPDAIDRARILLLGRSAAETAQVRDPLPPHAGS